MGTVLIGKARMVRIKKGRKFLREKEKGDIAWTFEMKLRKAVQN